MLAKSYMLFGNINIQTEYNGIEKRLDELSERLARLEPLKSKPRVKMIRGWLRQKNG